MGWEGRWIRLRIERWCEARRVCVACWRPVERFRFTCENEACRLAALEAQAMLAPSEAARSRAVRVGAKPRRRCGERGLDSRRVAVAPDS